MALSEELQFEIDGALAQIDQLGAQLGAIAQEFKVELASALDVLAGVAITDVDATSVTASIDDAVSAADASVVPEVETGGITEGIDAAVSAADASVTPDVDAAPITGEIESAVADADAVAVIGVDADAITGEIEAAADDADAVVVVEADTGQAEEAVEGLGSGAGRATEEVGGLADATGLLGAGALLAQGQVAGLGAGAQAAGGAMAGAAIGVGSLAAAAGFFFSQALQSETAQRRWNAALGDMADEVQNVNVGGLTGDLFELAEAAGSDDEAMKLAGARIADLGRNAGASEPTIAATAQSILVLATRATAMNPTLGEAGAVADRMTNAFARGGRALAPYGIALSSAEINARALADTGKATADQLTIFDKAAAGAAITTERLGDSLGTDLAEAMKNPEVQLRSLAVEFGNFIEEVGAPIVVPAIDALRAGQPVAEDLAESLGRLAVAVLPLVIVALQGVATVVGPVAGGLSDVLGFVGQLPDPVIAAGLALLLMARGFQALGGIEGAGRALSTFVEAARTGSAPVGGFAAAAGRLAPAILALTAIYAVGKGFEDFAPSVDKSAESLSNAAPTAASFRDELDRLTDPSLGERAAQVGTDITNAFTFGLVDRAADTTKTKAIELFRSLAEESPVAAQAVIDSMRQAGESTGEFEAILAASAAEQGKVNAASEAYQQQVAQTEADLRRQAAAQGDVNAAQEDAISKYSELNDEISQFMNLLDQIVNPQLDAAEAAIAVADAQDKLAEALGKSGGSLDINNEKGRDAASALTDVIKKVEEHGAALRRNGDIQDTDIAQKEATLQGLRNLQVAYPDLAPAIQPYIDKIGEIPDEKTTYLKAVPAELLAAAAAGLAAVYGIPQQWLTTLLGDPTNTRQAVNDAVTAITGVPRDWFTLFFGDSGNTIGEAAAARGGVFNVPQDWLTRFQGNAQGLANAVAEAQRIIAAVRQVVETTVRVSVQAATGVAAAVGPPRQHGGAFHANQLFPVGEVEREFVMFSQPGVVFTQADLRAALAGQASPVPVSDAASVFNQFNDIDVHEVAQDPRATAEAVGARLGLEASRR